jgi:hypothetical protein
MNAYRKPPVLARLAAPRIDRVGGGRRLSLLGPAVLLALTAGQVQAEDKAAATTLLRSENADRAAQTVHQRSVVTLVADGRMYRVAVYGASVAANTVQVLNQTASGLSVMSSVLTTPLQIGAHAHAIGACPSAWGQTLLSLGQAGDGIEGYVDVQCGDSVQVREVKNNG